MRWKKDCDVELSLSGEPGRSRSPTGPEQWTSVLSAQPSYRTNENTPLACIGYSKAKGDLEPMAGGEVRGDGGSGAKLCSATPVYPPSVESAGFKAKLVSIVLRGEAVTESLRPTVGVI